MRITAVLLVIAIAAVATGCVVRADSDDRLWAPTVNADIKDALRTIMFSLLEDIDNIANVVCNGDANSYYDLTSGAGTQTGLAQAIGLYAAMLAKYGVPSSTGSHHGQSAFLPTLTEIEYDGPGLNITAVGITAIATDNVLLGLFSGRLCGQIQQAGFINVTQTGRDTFTATTIADGRSRIFVQPPVPVTCFQPGAGPTCCNINPFQAGCWPTGAAALLNPANFAVAQATGSFALDFQRVQSGDGKSVQFIVTAIRNGSKYTQIIGNGLAWVGGPLYQ